jgi:hypothetical protein
MFKLLVIEPWEFGTLNGVGPFNVSLRKGVKSNWLIIFDITIIYKGERTNYLMSKTERKHAETNLLEEMFNNVKLETALMSGLNEQNYMNYDIDGFRGEFLTGELSSHS